MVLATGCRERPRSARLVPGSRPAGVMTTSTLQQLVHLRGQKVGRRAVIVGAEHVSFSAVATLAHAGASVAGLVTELPRHQSLAAFVSGRRFATGRRSGRARRSARSTAPSASSPWSSRSSTPAEPARVDCDLVDLHRRLDPGPRAGGDGRLRARSRLPRPARRPGARTTRRGVFAAGNCCIPAETADICALDGRHVAPSVAAYLRGSGEWPSRVRIDAREPLAWVAPNLLLAGGHAAAARPLPAALAGVRPSRAASRSGRTDGSSGAVVPAGSSRAARRISRPSWAARVDPSGGPVIAGVK